MKMLNRNIQRFFTLRSKKTYVPKIFYHPKFNTKGGQKKAEPRITPEYQDYLDKMKNINNLLKKREIEGKSDERMEALYKLDLSAFKRREIMEFFWNLDKEEHGRLLSEMGYKYLLYYGYDLNIIELNKIMKHSFINKRSLEPKTFAILVGLFGKFLGPNIEGIKFVQDDFRPEVFRSPTAIKMLVNLMNFINDNYHSEIKIQSNPKCTDIFHRMLYKYMLVMNYYIENDKFNSEPGICLHGFQICSENLPIAFFPDTKVIPCTEKYDRPSEVLLDNKWAESVKKVAASSLTNTGNLKLRTLDSIIKIHLKISSLNEEVLNIIIDGVNANIEFINKNLTNINPSYLINRLCKIYIAADNKSDTLNNIIIEQCEKLQDSYLEEINESFEDIIDFFKNSWVGENPSNSYKQTNSKNNKIKNLNLFLRNCFCMNKMKLSNKIQDKLFDKICISSSNLIEDNKLEYLLLNLEFIKSTKEARTIILGKIAQGISPNNKYSSFSKFDIEKLKGFKTNIEKVFSADELSQFAELIPVIDNKIEQKSDLAN